MINLYIWVVPSLQEFLTHQSAVFRTPELKWKTFYQTIKESLEQIECIEEGDFGVNKNCHDDRKTRASHNMWIKILFYNLHRR